jgi:hypothetical protein
LDSFGYQGNLSTLTSTGGSSTYVIAEQITSNTYNASFFANQDEYNYPKHSVNSKEIITKQ